MTVSGTAQQSLKSGGVDNKNIVTLHKTFFVQLFQLILYMV